MSAEKQTNSLKYYVHCAVFIFLLFFIRLIPPFGEITALGMQVLSVFVGLIYGWIFIGFAWPSLFGLMALGLTGCFTGVTDAVCNGFSQSMVWQVFIMLLFAGMLKQMGVTEFIGHWFLSRKICSGHPWVLTTMLFVVSVLSGGLITMFATIFMLWAIFYDIAKVGGFKKGDNYTAFTLSGIVFFTVIASLVFPFRPFAYMVLGLVKTVGITEIPMMSWLITGLFTISVMIAVWLLIGKFVFRIDLSSLADSDTCAKYRHEKITGQPLFGLILLAVMIVVLLAPSVFPGSWGIIALFKRLDLIGIAIILTCIGLVIRKKDGSLYFTVHKLAQELNWDLILMFAVTLPLGAAMESGETGIIATVMGGLSPLFSTMSPIVFTVTALILFGIITQVAHNLVLMIVFTPVLANLCVTYGIPPLLFLLRWHLSCNVPS